MNIEFKQKLETDIEFIVSEIHKLVKSKIVSIILYGSYGRNEGAFYRKNNKIYVYNDYDLLLIVNDIIPDKEIQYIKQALLDKLDVRWIDISQERTDNLRKLKPTIFNFDLKYGSRVIDGSNGILNTIPSFKSEQLTLKEAEVLYFTRLYTLLGSLRPNAFMDGVEGEESRFFRNQMAKAVLAVVDILLLQKNIYHTSYRERVDRLVNMYPLKKELIDLSRWALYEKMTPSAPTMHAKETKDFHSQIVSLYQKEMFIALSKYYRRKIKSTDDLKKAQTYSLKEIIIQIKVLILNGTMKSHNKSKKINLLQSYAAEFYIKKGMGKKDIINKCKIQIQELDVNQNVTDIDWDALRNLIVKLSR
jgi:hypothetical protein